VRRLIAVATALACLALPASGLAQAPGYREVALPATIHDIVFATDGTIYGTVDHSDITPSRNPGVVWRSSDHGRTWAAAYRWPIGWRVELLQVSPADPTIVYATVYPPQPADGGLTRIDTRAGIATPLSVGSWIGVDAAGTVYGSEEFKSKPTLISCRRRRDTCDRIQLPNFQSSGIFYGIAVDPNAAGVLVTVSRALDGAGGVFLEVSQDGGATWTQGAPFITGGLLFAGPGARTLYSLASAYATVPGMVSVSRDAGLTWYSQYALPQGTLIVGSGPSIGTGSGAGPLVTIGDGGVGAQVGSAPMAGGPAVDPTDPARIFMLGQMESWLSDDSGATWRKLTGAQFGETSIDASTISGSGRYLYATGPGVIWYSHDAGATWAESVRPPGEVDRRPFVSRDDPRVAYANTSVPAGDVTGLIRTLDGGVTWQTVATSGAVPVSWIEQGNPLHLFSNGGRGFVESTNGGVTWFDPPQPDWCVFEVLDDTTSPTGQRLRCNGFWTAADPLRPLPAPVPYAPGLIGSPDAPGSYAIALPVNASFNHQTLLGALAPDWSWSSLLAPTGAYGPATATSDAVDAWPTPGGTVFYAWDAKAGSTWVRRGAGRWWRLRVDGHDMAVLATLDATHALVGTPGQYGARGVVDLALPPVAAPRVQPAHGGLTCVVPWDAADAVASTPSWLRDGSVIAGASGADYAPAAADAGHALACRVTAHTDFGSSTVTSVPYAPPQSAAAVAKLSLTGTARVGRALRCGAAVRLTWFRDGKALKGRHARTFAVGASDRGHTLACQTRRPDGTVARSRAALIRA
jgi:hypothetical protein